MPRPQRNWERITITISPEMASALRDLADLRHECMGTIADEVLQLCIKPKWVHSLVRVTGREIRQLVTDEVVREIGRHWRGPVNKMEIAHNVVFPGESVLSAYLEARKWNRKSISVTRLEYLLPFLSSRGYEPSIYSRILERDHFSAPRAPR